MSKPYTWQATLTVKVDPIWVADGFDLSEERLNCILQEAFENELGFATEGEVQVSGTVTKAPDRKRILVEQGYQQEEDSRCGEPSKT